MNTLSFPPKEKGGSRTEGEEEEEKAKRKKKGR
jgi:hypothetical protein